METKQLKYTGGMAFVIIGLLSFAFLAVNHYGVLDNLENDDQFRSHVEETLQNSEDEELNGVTADELVEFFRNSVIFMIVLSVVLSIFGIVATILLNKRKRVKVVGILLIIAALLGTFLTLRSGLFGGVAYLIAGILVLVRHRKIQMQAGQAST